MQSVTTQDGVRLAVLSAGEGAPVVLLHGLTATHRYVVMGSRALERSGHRVVSYDARGHGASTPAPAPDGYRYERLAEDLLAVLDQLEIERPTLAGASMGAHTIVRFALDRPQRVGALAILTPAYVPRESEAEDSAALAHWDALARGLREGGAEGFLAAYDTTDLDERWRATIEQVVLQRLSAHEHPEAVADALEAVPRSAPFADIGDLASLRMPAIVIGSRDEADPGHPLRVAEIYANAIPGARLYVEEAGSSPLAWQGGRVSKLLAELSERSVAAAAAARGA